METCENIDKIKPKGKTEPKKSRPRSQIKSKQSNTNQNEINNNQIISDNNQTLSNDNQTVIDNNQNNPNHKIILDYFDKKIANLMLDSDYQITLSTQSQVIVLAMLNILEDIDYIKNNIKASKQAIQSYILKYIDATMLDLQSTPEEKITGRGGYRPGAGRPKAKEETINLLTNIENKEA